ncbi:14106_t:CDS:2 [Rhizophagus irregularis]|nr:14106_t:CDS:2 [Rhizophagus irregularis]
MPTDGIKPVKLVETLGARFTLCDREDTIETLRNGGGTECSNRVNIIHYKVLYSGDKDVKSRLGKQFFLNVTYGNGSMASDFDVDIKAESSKALRILYSYFVNGNKNLNFNRFRDIIGEGNTNQLRLCLETIYENKLKEDRNINCLAIIIDIDEVNKLYPTFRNLVSIVGSTSYPSGKVYEPHEKLRDLGFDGNYVYNNDPFRRMVSDIGGQTRQHLMDLARHQAIQNNKLEKKIDQLTKRNVELKQQMRRIMKYIV